MHTELNHELVRALVIEQGLSQAEIARAYGVKRQAVWHHLHNRNPSSRPIRIAPRKARESLPWDVQHLHKGSTPYHRLHNHARNRIDGRLSDQELGRLRSFYEVVTELDIVVTYDPTVGPQPGMRNGGWAFPARQDSDGNSLIRAEGMSFDRDFWAIPEVADWPDI
jgi:hypothetical protein